MLKEHKRRPGGIVRMLAGGMLVLLSLPLLLPLIVGALITGAICGVRALAGSRSGGRDE